MIAAADSAGPGGRYAEVIGDPIAHSRSPALHGFWLAAAGIAASYRAVHVVPDALSGYLDRRRDDPLWLGCNVTIPHKLAVLDHVADPGDVRGSIGAANTLFRGAGDMLQATNTDAAGFFAPIADLAIADRPVIIIGAGGAARAVLFALARLGVGRVTILARNALKAGALLAHFGLKGQVLPMTARLPPAALLVNASPLGMVGVESLTIDLSLLPEDAVVYDLVYTPLVTPLLAAAEARGLGTIDGLDMLIGQAALAFELFFGSPPPEGDDAALRRLLTA